MTALSMNSLSEVVNDIDHNNNKFNRSMNRIPAHDYRDSNHDEKYYQSPPNPSISFTATSTGTPIIITTTTTGGVTNDSPPPSSPSATPTSSVGGGEQQKINENNNSNNNIINDNNSNINNTINPEEEVLEKEGELDDGVLKRPSQYDNRRNLHVDTLPPITEVEFRSLFLPFGTIARSRIVTDVVTGLPSGYGFVMFEREEDAFRALQSLHNKILPNTTRPLRITYKKPKSLKAVQREKEKEKERDDLLANGHTPSLSTLFVNTNLYVAGIPLSWKKIEFDEIFSPYGTILESRILTDRTTGLSKGVGFIRYQQLESCHNAIKLLNGKPPLHSPPDSQNLTVRFAVDRTAQALAVAQQTVMASVGNGKGGIEGKNNKNKYTNINNAIGNIMIDNTIANRSMTTNGSPVNNNPSPPPPPSLLTPSPAHLSPNHYLQFQAMIALHQQQQMIANRSSYPFSQSSLSMTGVGSTSTHPLLLSSIAPLAANPSSPQMTVQFLNHNNNPNTNDNAYYSQVFV